jgi:UDP-N-acetylmuramoyl-tripeptide--D-alanyl-D-alanine ligase
MPIYWKVHPSLRPRLVPALRALARMKRSWRKDLRIVLVTGSAGKTTTSEMIAAALGGADSVHLSSSMNMPFPVLKRFLRTRRRHRYFVAEVGIDRVGVIDQAAPALKPDVVVVTSVGYDHYETIGSIEAIAEQKGKLVTYLRPGGVAVLNADDARVAAAALRTRERVITYGRGPDATVRAIDWRDSFPDPLTVTVDAGEGPVVVQTQLHGEYWVSAVLAAISAAMALGIPAREAAGRLAEVAPVFRRCSMHAVPDGPVFLLDAFKSRRWTLPQFLNLVRKAKPAPRSTIMLGNVRDPIPVSDEQHLAFVDEALSLADRLIVVGTQAANVSRVAGNRYSGRLFLCGTAREARDLIHQTAIREEVIFIKSLNIQHLERIYLDFLSPASCWTETCQLRKPCNRCSRYAAA